MSTKTTFKRVALVAVAALGLGVLSVAPSSATVSSVVVTTAAGTASQIGADGISATVNADSTTAGSVTVSSLHDTLTDTVTVGIQTKSAPTGATGAIRLVYVETSTPLASTTKVGNSVTANSGVTKYDSITAGSSVFSISHTSTGYVGAKFKLQLDSATAGYPAGTYVTTVVVKAYSAGVAAPVTTTYDVSTVVSKATTQATTPSALYSTAYLGAGTTVATTTDAVVSAVATADATQVGNVDVVIKNASQTTGVAQDSLTASITGAGLISVDGGTTWGKSFVYNVTAGAVNVKIRADGTAGVGTIALATTTTTFSPKTVTFYAKSPKTITAAVNVPVLTLGANLTAVAATAVDANGTAWTGQLYIVASAAADALIGGSATVPVACSYNSTYKVHFCPIKTIAAGSASFKVVDETLDTDADATTYAAADSAASSAAVTVKSSVAVATAVKLAFDKASYAPFEKATITVTPVDSSGNAVAAKSYTDLFAAGGITSSYAFSAASDTLTAVSFSTEASTSAAAGTVAGAKTYTVYMPAAGTVTITATGGASLPGASQIAYTASATVVNSSVDAATDAANEATDAANAATDAALAAADAADAATAAAQDASDAVAALSASVEKLVASLKAQLTSLTNLVIKIQKKVKA